MTCAHGAANRCSRVAIESWRAESTMKRLNLIRYGSMAYGLMMASAVVFVFIPQDTMVHIGAVCHLPPFEITPVFEYMARGLALMAFLFGLLMFYFAFHLSEQIRLISLLGWTALGLIPVAIWIHVMAQTPLWWRAGDTIGLLILWLLSFLSRNLKELEASGLVDATVRSV